jgi:predicted transposase/invertase (TIGR01784 family)
MKLFNLFRSLRDNSLPTDKFRPDITTDLVFKFVFSGSSQDSKDALISLLSSCIHRQVSRVRILNSESLPEFLGAKTVRFDILAEFNDGEKADVEMQLTGSKAAIAKRSAYYAAKLLAGQARGGEDYQDLKRVYQIFFLDFTLVPESPKWPRRYGFREETEQDLLTELVEIVVYEIPKLAETVKLWLNRRVRFEELRGEDRWCIYFLCKAGREMEAVVRELCRVEEGIMKAEKELGKVSWSVRRWAKKYMKEKREMDRRWIMNEMKEQVRAEGRAEGFEQGLAKGLEQNREIARNLKALGVPVEKIASATGLSVEEIEKP